MWGAIIGDLAGSIYEYEQTREIKSIKTDKIIPDEAFFSDDLLYVAAFSTGLYYGFRRLEPEDIYKEICRK